MESIKINNNIGLKHVMQLLLALHQKGSFALKISLVNVTRSAENCRFGHIYRANRYWKTSFFVQSCIVSIFVFYL